MKAQPRITDFFRGPPDSDFEEVSSGDESAPDVNYQFKAVNKSGEELENVRVNELDSSKRPRLDHPFFPPRKFQPALRSKSGNIIAQLMGRETGQRGNNIEPWLYSRCVPRKLHNYYCTIAANDPWEQPLQLGVSTVCSMQLDPTGQILAISTNCGEVQIFDFTRYRVAALRADQTADNVDHIEAFSSTILRTGTGLLEPDVHRDDDEPLSASMTCKFPNAPLKIQWNSADDDEIVAVFDQQADIRFFNVATEQFSGVLKGDDNVRGFSSFHSIVKRNLAIAGSVDGRVQAWDRRIGKPKPIWSFKHDTACRMLSLVEMDDRAFMCISALGSCLEIDLSKPPEKAQAFSSLACPKLHQKRLLSDLKISSVHAAIVDETHPSRMALLTTGGKICSLDRKRWKLRSNTVDSRVETEDLRGFRPEYGNCFGYLQKGSPMVYSVRKYDERWVDLYDMDHGKLVVSLEFHKRVSSLCAHPEGNLLVYSLHQEERIRTIGLL